MLITLVCLRFIMLSKFNGHNYAEFYPFVCIMLCSSVNKLLLLLLLDSCSSRHALSFSVQKFAFECKRNILAKILTEKWPWPVRPPLFLRLCVWTLAYGRTGRADAMLDGQHTSVIDAHLYIHNYTHAYYIFICRGVTLVGPGPHNDGNKRSQL